MNRKEAKAARIARRLPRPRVISRDSGALDIRMSILKAWFGSKHEPAREEIAAAAQHTVARRTFKGIYSEPTRRVLAEIGAQRRRAGK